MKKIQWLMRQGLLSSTERTRTLHSTASKLTHGPMYTGCQYAKQRRKTAPGTTRKEIHRERHALKTNDLFPATEGSFSASPHNHSFSPLSFGLFDPLDRVTVDPSMFGKESYVVHISSASRFAMANSSNIPSLSFRGGIKLLFAWEIFWLWCWFMTASFMWTGEYNSFNEGGFITKSVPVVLFCTVLSLISAILTGMYLFDKDTTSTRLGLVISSGIMFVVAVVFVIGGVPIMWIDIVAMAYSLKKTWDHYMLSKNNGEKSQ